MIKNVYWSSRKVLVIVFISWWISNYLEGFSKNSQASNFVDILPVEVYMFHTQTDGQTDGERGRGKWLS